MIYIGVRVFKEELILAKWIRELSTLYCMKVKVKDQATFHKIPRPRLQTRELIESLGISMPTTLTHREVPVVKRKKLQKKRK